MTMIYEQSGYIPNPIEIYSFKKRKNKKMIKIFLSIFIILSLILSIFLISYIMGYIPILTFLETKAPIGNPVEISKYEIQSNFPEFNNIKGLEKIKYCFYKSDATIKNIKNNYQERLKNEGYSLLIDGSKTINGNTFFYYGYIKGFTAVAFILSNDFSDIIGENTLVFYSTGSVFDFKDILGNINDFNEFFEGFTY